MTRAVLDEDQHNVIRVPGVAPCWVCGERADYVELSFEAPMCGGTCIWASWEALRLHDTPWRAWC